MWLVSLLGNIGLLVLWLPYALAGDEGALSIALLSPVMVVYASLGWLILRHRPGHPVGWILLGATTLVIVFAGGIGLGAPLAESRGPDDFLAGALVTVAVAMLVPMFVMTFGMLPILYPDGRLPGPRWRGPVRAVVAGTVLSAAGFLLAPTADPQSAVNNPFAPPGTPAALSDITGVVGTVTAIAAGVLAMASVIVRFRRGHGDERQQLKWMLAPVVVVVAANLPTFLGADVGDLLSVVQVGAMLLVPIAITAAILRYRLYDIDRLISRTIAYAVVTAILVAIFTLGTLVLQTTLEGITQGDTIAVAGSTLIAFAAAQPLWRRVRRLVDRRFDRARIRRQAHRGGVRRPAAQSGRPAGDGRRRAGDDGRLPATRVGGRVAPSGRPRTRLTTERRPPRHRSRPVGRASDASRRVRPLRPHRPRRRCATSRRRSRSGD